MYYIDKNYTNTLEVKQSKFITHLIPYEHYQSTLEALKLQYPKARHFVVSYRYLNEFDQIVEHSSDDGEPKGTSGKPTLFVLQGAELINCAVIVVRYFGGTKLGTGGLVRAYSDAVNLVVNIATLLEYKEMTKKRISFEYSDLRMVEYECEIHQVKILKKVFDSGALFEIEAPLLEMQKFLETLQRVLRVVS